MGWVRDTTAAPVVLGGAGFTVMPSTILEVLDAEYGVVGEGEALFPWLLRELAAGRVLESRDGVVCEVVGRSVLVQASRKITRLDSQLPPALDLFDVDWYYRRGGCVNVQTSAAAASTAFSAAIR